MHNINVNNLSVQNVFFHLHDAILFQGHGKSQAQDLQLGVVECKVYHNILMNTKSQVRKNFLNHIEESMSHDSLIESKTNTRSKKSVSCSSKTFPPSVFSHDTKESKV
jgi:hypothetical protein